MQAYVLGAVSALRTEGERAAAIRRRQRAHGKRQQAGLLRRDHVRVAGSLRSGADAHLLRRRRRQDAPDLQAQQSQQALSLEEMY